VTAGGPNVRPATVDDLDVVADLLTDYLEFYDIEADVERSRAYLAAHLVAGTAVVLVAECEADGIVGFTQCYPTWDTLSLGPHVVLYDLFVAPHARRHGVGRALLRGAVVAARDSGAQGVSLETAHDNLEARALYESEGFVRDDRFHAYHLSLVDPPVDAGGSTTA
jgi:ribosomal protein S18 acetylase RimI-like enzyme